MYKIKESERIMKKKFLAVVMAATLCLAMGVTTFAAESTEGTKPDAKPPVETVVTEEQVSALVNGKEVAVDVKPVDEKVQEAVEKEGFVESVIEENLTTNPEVAKKLQDADEVVVLGSVDIHVELNEGETAQIVIDSMEGIQAGDSVYALHQKDDGSWEIIDVVVNEDGSLTLTMTGFSPVVFVKTASVDVPDVPKDPATPEDPDKTPANDNVKDDQKADDKKADNTKSDDKKAGSTTTAVKQSVSTTGKSPKTGDR